jgi:hypothetical protein
MSLNIGVFYMDETTGKKTSVDLGEGKHLGGVESTRLELWGAEIMAQLGLVILPRLKEEAIVIIKDNDLDIAETEALTIQENLNSIAFHTGYDKEYIVARTNNVINAVRKAKELDGHVFIS